MTELMLTYGNAGLFLTAFLAATLLPLSSEALLIYLVHQTGDPWTPLFWASAGNVLGSMVNYALGYYGESFIFYRLLKLKPQTLTKARQQYQKYGPVSLLFAWLPLVGDPLTVVAGAFKMPLWLFVLLVAAGKTGRYLFLVLAIPL